MPMGWAAALGAAGTIGGAIISGNAAGDAAQTQSDSAAAANKQQMDMYNQNVQRLAPYNQAGMTSLNNLQGLMGSNGANGALTTPFSAQQYQQSPGYQFQLQQGGQAVTNAASATGGVNGGNTLKALTQYGQGLANQDYYQAANQYSNWQNQVYNMNSNMVNNGQASAAGTAAMGSNVASQMGQNTIGAGNANAAGQVGQANAYSGALGSLGNLAQYQQMYNQISQQPGGSNYIPPIDASNYPMNNFKLG